MNFAFEEIARLRSLIRRVRGDRRGEDDSKDLAARGGQVTKTRDYPESSSPGNAITKPSELEAIQEVSALDLSPPLPT